MCEYCKKIINNKRILDISNEEFNEEKSKNKESIREQLK